MDNRKTEDRREPEIVYSRSVKAGKRIYYLDVKKARNADLYVCITESKKRSMGEAEPPSFEKHKLFLYKEDFAHFVEGLEDVIGYVKEQVGEIEDRAPYLPSEEADAADGDAVADADDRQDNKSGLFGFFRGK